MKTKCTICAIIDKSSKNFIVYEDDLLISFLDIKPLFIGHCLLAPKQHIRTIYDLQSSHGNGLLGAIQIIGNGITSAMHAQGTFIALNNNVSQSIDHLHIHLVPRNKGDGLKGFFWPRTKYKNEDEMSAVQFAIKAAIGQGRDK